LQSFRQLCCCQYCGSLRTFDVGDTHRLRLKEKLAANPSPFESVVDPYKDEGGTRYLCLKADLFANADAERLDSEEEELYSEEDDEDVEEF